MRLYFELYTRCSSDPEQRLSVLGPRKDINEEYRPAFASTGPGPGAVLVPAGATNWQVPFGSVGNASYVLIVMRAPVECRIGASGTYFPLNGVPADPNAYPYSDVVKTPQPGILFISTTSIPAGGLYFNNPDLVNAAPGEVHLFGEGP